MWHTAVYYGITVGTVDLTCHPTVVVFNNRLKLYITIKNITSAISATKALMTAIGTKNLAMKLQKIHFAHLSCEFSKPPSPYAKID